MMETMNALERMDAAPAAIRTFVGTCVYARNAPLPYSETVIWHPVCGTCPRAAGRAAHAPWRHARASIHRNGPTLSRTASTPSPHAINPARSSQWLPGISYASSNTRSLCGLDEPAGSEGPQGERGRTGIRNVGIACGRTADQR